MNSTDQWFKKRETRWVLAVMSVLLVYVIVSLSPGPGPANERPTASFDAVRGARSPGKAPAPGIRAALGLEAVSGTAGMPTGRGIVGAHVEGNLGDYAPAVNAGQFAGVHMILRSGPSIVSGHAQGSARIIYGPNGLAPGVRRVNVYSSFHWLRAGYLRTGQPEPPRLDNSRFMSHSWAGRGRNDWTIDALRRIDWVIDAHDVIVIAGVLNERDAPVPPLLASAHNVISVGNWVGQSSGGYTLVEVPGRCKPDLVGPLGKTSSATPVVAAIVARLLEAADRSAEPRASRAEVIKAVLLAGAEKTEEWFQELGRPLDSHLGAGRVRFDSSLRILGSGPLDPGPVPRHTRGWDFQQIARGQGRSYLLHLDETADEISIVLTWHRRIDGRTLEDLVTQVPRWVNIPTTADLDLQLVRVVEDTSGSQVPLARSTSSIDNVEHVFLRDVPPGRYRLDVSRSDRGRQPWEYAVAWRIRADPPGPAQGARLATSRSPRRLAAGDDLSDN